MGMYNCIQQSQSLSLRFTTFSASKSPTIKQTTAWKSSTNNNFADFRMTDNSKIKSAGTPRRLAFWWHRRRSFSTAGILLLRLVLDSRPTQELSNYEASGNASLDASATLR